MMTGRYVLQFPRGIVISIVPNDTSQLKQSEFWENFRARIKKAFAEYTEETNPDYIVQDKLEFIDLIRELNFNVSAEQIINERMRNTFDYKNEVCSDDICDTNVIEELIDEGVSMYKRGWHHWSGDNHVDKIASVLVADAIKTVLEYSEIEVDNR